MKNNLKKTVLSVIGRLKIGSKKFHYILTSDIEWTYVFNELLPSSTTTYTKEISEVEFDKDLDSIKEKYAMLTLQVPQKKQNTRHNINLYEEDIAFISKDDPTELVEVRIQEVMPEIKENIEKNFVRRKNNYLVRRVTKIR
ncbi:hypothetical protein F8M41_020852 [Gigaspora margarita]|uniref:Uncharacterized protein n=1 Tax=Gigaspora margarita TaxID=4874 RepID=A0A8H4AHR9_GIGMA|nr:hypothetical protein F8M41_020852 [Gigaspora margarita]